MSNPICALTLDLQINQSAGQFLIAFWCSAASCSTYSMMKLATAVLKFLFWKYTRLFLKLTCICFNYVIEIVYICLYLFLSNLRPDTLSQLLNYGNIMHGSNVAVVETCQGLVLACLLQRMGGMLELHVVFTCSFDFKIFCGFLHHTSSKLAANISGKSLFSSNKMMLRMEVTSCYMLCHSGNGDQWCILFKNRNTAFLVLLL